MEANSPFKIKQFLEFAYSTFYKQDIQEGMSGVLTNANGSEDADNDEDWRSDLFRKQIFELFALNFYYMHFTVDLSIDLFKKHKMHSQECPVIIRDLFIAIQASKIKNEELT